MEEGLHLPGPEISAVRGGEELTCLHTLLILQNSCLSPGLVKWRVCFF